MNRTPSLFALFVPILALALPGCETSSPDSVGGEASGFGGETQPAPATGPEGMELDPVVDADGDGSPAGTDCDDNDATAYPGATEADDQADDDCDGWVDEDFVVAGDIIVTEVNRRSLVGTVSVVNNASWVEVHNTSSRTVDMSNWVVSRGTTAPYNSVSIDPAAAPVLAPGGYAVFCDTNDYEGSTASYPLTCDYVWGDESQAASYVGTYHDNTFYLRRDTDTFALYIGGSRTTGTLVDAVAYVIGWPREARFTMSLDAAYFDGTLNDSVNAWCTTTSTTTASYVPSNTWRWYDTPANFKDEHGTPGADNYDCQTDYDFDGDGYTGATDCDETDATVNPGATEECDGVDNDCDGTVDNGGTGSSTWYADSDSDTFGAAATSQTACSQPTGYVADATDCDDTSATSYPGATEQCDGVDNDCDGTIDDGLGAGSTYYADADADTYGDLATTLSACALPAGYVTDSTDCDDADATSNPGGTEVCDGADNDCDSIVDNGGTDGTTYYLDADTDGQGAAASSTVDCSVPVGYVTNSTDCDDADATAYVGGVEIDDLADDDCDGWVDEDFVVAGDIIVTEINKRSQMNTGGLVINASWVEVKNTSTRTVDLANWVVSRGTTAPYNQVTLDPASAPVLLAGEYAVFCDTNDYEGSAAAYLLACDYVWGDETQISTYVGTYHDNTFYVRRDADTFALYLGGTRTTGTLIDSVAYVLGWSNDARFSLSLDPSSLTSTANDTAANWCSTTANSSGGVSNNSSYAWYDNSGTIRDEYGTPGAANYDCIGDADGDGYDATTDCDDTNAAIHPGATETCNGVDDDCDGIIDDAAVDPSLWYADLDADAYGDALTVTSACDQPASYVANSTDCDDADATINPLGTEVCDGIDNNCNGAVDDGATGASTWYADADSDTYGAAATSQAACTQPTGYVANATDCDDTSATNNPAGTEVCDGVDNDCDTLVDEGVTGSTWYADVDVDGYGNAASSQAACTQPTGYVADSTDCDDTNASINPLGTEVCNNGVDENCDADPTPCEWTGSGYPKTTYDLRVYGTAANYAVGTSIAMNGDLNGDGYDDAIIGQQYGDTTPATDNGYVHVWYGPVNTSDALGTADLSIAGATTVNYDYFGSSVRFAGDVDGDTLDDLLGSAYKSGSDDRGTTYLFYGGTTATSVGSADASFSTSSSPTNSWIGQAIDGGDVDGDGRADVLVSAWGRSTRGGAVGLWNATAIVGGAEDFATDATLLITGEAAGDDLGYTASMGDLDGDGMADLILGAPASTSTTAAGKVYIFTGVATATGTVSASTADAVLSGSVAADRYGISVAWLGDTDLDGTNDFAVGADKYDGSATDAGAAFVYTSLPSGAVAGASTATTTFTGETASDYAGRMVAAVGDINGDGFADMSVGATGYDPAGNLGGGALYFFYGALPAGTVSASTWDFQFVGANTTDAVGYAAAGQGDVDADGIGDFMTSAPSWDGFGYLNAGGAWLYYGTGE